MPDLDGRRDLTLGDPSVVLDIVFRTIFHTVLAIALYLHMAGHNNPGGGFIAGLVVGAVLVLRLITGRPQFGARRLVRSEVLIGVGILLAAGMGFTSLVLGNTFLEHHTWELDLVVFGEVKITTALIFDTGVLLVVVGVIATLLEVFGSEGDEPAGIVEVDSSEDDR